MKNTIIEKITKALQFRTYNLCPDNWVEILIRMTDEIRDPVIEVLTALNNPQSIGADKIRFVDIDGGRIYIQSCVSRWQTYTSTKISNDYTSMIGTLSIKEEDNIYTEVIEKQGLKVAAVSPGKYEEEILIKSVPEFDVILNTESPDGYVVLTVEDTSHRTSTGLQRIEINLDYHNFKSGNIDLKQVLNIYNLGHILIDYSKQTSNN